MRTCPSRKDCSAIQPRWLRRQPLLCRWRYGDISPARSSSFDGRALISSLNSVSLAPIGSWLQMVSGLTQLIIKLTLLLGPPPLSTTSPSFTKELHDQPCLSPLQFWLHLPPLLLQPLLHLPWKGQSDNFTWFLIGFFEWALAVGSGLSLDCYWKMRLLSFVCFFLFLVLFLTFLLFL